MRGLQATRIETFTDAAFAFALTLLVIAFEPLTSFSEMLKAMEVVPPFLASAAMLMMFWWGHHEWSRRYGLDDMPTFLLSCALVCTVLLFVYPLRFLCQLMEMWICGMLGITLTTHIVVEGPGDINGAFVVYGIGFALMSGVLFLLHLHALRKRAELQLTQFELSETYSAMAVWGTLAIVGVLSMTAALVVPTNWYGAPGWLYAMLPLLIPVFERRARRAALRRAPPEGGALEVTETRIEN